MSTKFWPRKETQCSAFSNGCKRIIWGEIKHTVEWIIYQFVKNVERYNWNMDPFHNKGWKDTFSSKTTELFVLVLFWDFFLINWWWVSAGPPSRPTLTTSEVGPCQPGHFLIRANLWISEKSQSLGISNLKFEFNVEYLHQLDFYISGDFYSYLYIQISEWAAHLNLGMSVNFYDCQHSVYFILPL